MHIQKSFSLLFVHIVLTMCVIIIHVLEQYMCLLSANHFGHILLYIWFHILDHIRTLVWCGFKCSMKSYSSKHRQCIFSQAVLMSCKSAVDHKCKNYSYTHTIIIPVQPSLLLSMDSFLKQSCHWMLRMIWTDTYV